MEKAASKKKEYQWILIILVIGAVLVNIKRIFVDFDADSEYAVAMAYRMVLGDKMIAQMWEPHQTSAFLCALFIKIYLALFGTTTGIVLYLNTLGVVIKGLFALMLYKTMKRYTSPTAVFYMCLFFFVTFPKEITIPEFANMQLCFSVGVFCCFLRFWENQNQYRWLVGTSLFLFLTVLAYPSCIIVYIGVVVLVWIYTNNRLKNIAVLTMPCLVLGGSLCVWLISYTGWHQFKNNLGYILSGDESHSQPLTEKMQGYFRELVTMFVILAVLAAVAWILQTILSKAVRVKGKAICFTGKNSWYIIYFILLLLFVLIHTLLVYDRHGHLVIYIPILCMAVGCGRYISSREKMIVNTGMVISVLCFVATLLLSNLPLSSSIGYLILAVCMAFIPATGFLEQHFGDGREWWRYALLWCFCGTIIFRGGYIFKPMNAYISTIFQLSGIVKEGPAMGLMSEYMGPYIINSSMEEWKQYVREGDRILLVGDGAVSTLGYLYENTVISVDSTICTPTYDEKLLEYWEQNPDKYPNVVIVDCWYGEMKMPSNSWIMQWIENEFQPKECMYGKFWCYYRSDMH